MEKLKQTVPEWVLDLASKNIDHMTLIYRSHEKADNVVVLKERKCRPK